MIPFQMEFTGETRVWQQKTEGRYYLGIENTVYDNEINFHILSLRDITEFCRNQIFRSWSYVLGHCYFLPEPVYFYIQQCEEYTGQ